MGDTEEDKDKGIRVLSLGKLVRADLLSLPAPYSDPHPVDNGGAGSHTQLSILREYTSRIANDLGVDECDVYLADYFELIGGVGFGGLIALMVGHLRMNAEEASEALVSIALAVFPLGAHHETDPETNMKTLRGAIEDMLQARHIPLDTKMNDKRIPSVKCKVALFATTPANLRHPTIFRTYPARSSGLNPTIVDTICATMATPSVFSSVKIGPRFREQNFVGGPLGANNPTGELLKEAGGIFGNDARVAQIINIGSGRPRMLSLNQVATSGGVNRLAEEMASDCEVVAHELSAKLFNVTAYLRLNVDRGMEQLTLNDWNDLGAIESHTNAYVETPTISEALEASLKCLRGRIGTVTFGQLRYSNNIKAISKSAPAVSPYYVLRQKELSLMVHHLVETITPSQKVFAITGMGGCGKTQMVSYFLREHRPLFTHVVFVDASSQSSIKADLQMWAQSLGNGHERDVWENGLKLLVSGSHDRRWVYILDNADDPELDLLPFLPKCYHGTVMITSRNRDTGHLANTYHLELGKMEPEEALSTLMQAARRQLPLSFEELKDVHQLMGMLGYLALALVHAGTYCQQLSSTVDNVPQLYSFTKYLALYKAQRAVLMNKAGPSMLDGYRRGVYTTLDLSYQVLPPTPKDFLHVLSDFHHSDISFSILETAVKNQFRDPYAISPRPDDHDVVVSHLSGLLCTEGVWDELKVQDTIQTLRSFSLVSTTVAGDTLLLQLHPLVQAWARDKKLLNSPDYRRMAGRLLTSCCSGVSNPLNRYLVPHINEMLHAVSCHPLHINDKVAVARVLKEQGHYRKAEVLFAEALDTMQDASSDYTKESLSVAGWLAETWASRGEWEKAEKLTVLVLDRRTRLLGLEHPETTRAAANLACTYRDQGRFDEAEKLELEVLEQRRRNLGLEHPDIIQAAANLASTYAAQGRFGEAEKLDVEVLEQRRRNLGLEHPDTILAAANLACTHRDQGRFDESGTLRLEVLEQSRRILGLEHPETIRAAANLACTYRDQGRFDEAEKLELEVLEQRRRNLGLEHPDTIQAAANLASTYAAQGRFGEAEKLDVEVLEQRRRNLGLEHPDTIQAAANLASTYAAQGRFGEAEKLDVEVLEQRRRNLGLEHPHTILAAANLACTYRDQGRFGEAEKLELEVLEQRRRNLGLEHPDTIQAAANLASTYAAQGRFGEAKKLDVEVLEQRRRNLGLEHPDTILAAANLACTYRDQGRFDESGTLRLEVLEQSRRILGLEHPETIRAAANLACTYRDQGRFDEAEKLELEVLEQRRRNLGLEHPDTIQAAANLASTYAAQGRFGEAEKLELEVLEQRRRNLGLEHPDTILAAMNLGGTYTHQGKWQEAETLIAPAVKSGIRVLGTQHVHTQHYIAHLVEVYKGLGKPDEATETEKLLLSKTSS